MSEAQTLVAKLIASQNPDGGWPYHKGISWSEPTAFVLLALQSDPTPQALSARQAALRWLLSQQKSSGGWSPNPDVAECTSVTSVATLALLSQDSHPSVPDKLDSALAWIASQVYPDDLSLSLLLSKALHLPPAHAPGSVAWYPGTAGWVTPTALSALTLLRAAQQRNRPDLKELADQSCAYLLSRRCMDSGWNHGGSSTRSEDAISYPETTGLALLALRAASVSLPAQSVALATRFAAQPGSIEGLSWIQLALESPADSIPDPPQIPLPRTTRDCALRLLLLQARQRRNVFLPEGSLV
jgi:hypothetical protein